MPNIGAWGGGLGRGPNINTGHSSTRTRNTVDRNNATSLAQLQHLQNQMNGVGFGGRQGGGDGGVGRVEQAHRRAFDLAELDRFRQMRDPADAFVMENLRDVATGENAPFNDETINNLRSVASDNSASAAAAQIKRLGGRPGDPGHEAARREIMSTRQARNQASDRDINTQARLQNFDAMQQALNRIFGFNADRQRRITDADRFLIDLLTSQRATLDTGI